MNNNAINLIAFGGKLVVESTSWNRLQKEGFKAGIDILADVMKDTRVTEDTTFSVMGLSVYQIRLVKEAAMVYGLDRVIIFPCPINSVLTPCLNMEGGDIAGFQKMLGVSPLKRESITTSESNLPTLIEQYGVILYQRKD